MVGGQRLQMEPTKDMTQQLEYSDTLLTDTSNTSTFTDANILPCPNITMDCLQGDALSGFLAEANFNEVLYPCNEPVLDEADFQNWDLSSLLSAV